MKLLNLLTTIFCLSSSLLFAQDASTVKSNSINYTVSTSDFETAKSKLDAYIDNNKILVVNVNSSKTYTQYNLSVNPEIVFSIDTLIKKLGYVVSKDFNSNQSTSEMAETKIELEYLENKKREYEKMQNKIDSVKSDRFYEHWQQVRDIDAQIFETKKKLAQYGNNTNKSTVNITLNDDITTPQNSRISFVNMPGVQYNYLMIENPKAGLSYKAYQGVTLKYMFTRGKSYFEFGAYKAIKSETEKSDTTAYDELFNFSFGQDFYPKHFGRGSRKFLNLYVGYSGGLMYCSNDNKSRNIYYIAPSIGLELFKSKNILLDTKGSYFLPFKDNRNLRGWNLSASFNFVF